MPAVRPQPASAAARRDGRPHQGLIWAAIIVATLIGLGLRLYQLSRPGYLLGVTEYDDGTDFGSALLLGHGYLPYRDFIIVQPPGITLLMAPVALLAKGASTAGAMAAGRLLTAVAGGAAVLLAGLLVRHRGLLAVILTCGVLAVYPASVQSAHTVLLEPWLVLFCLAGALAVFDGDQLAGWRRLAWGGAAFGFAGAIKAWAILPVLVILVLAARRIPPASGMRRAEQPRRAASFAAGVVAGFALPVLPFAVLAPRTFYHSVVVAQLVRVDAVRTPLAFRLREMTGLAAVSGLGTAPLLIIALAIALGVAACYALAWRSTGQRLALLDWFALSSSALTVVAFLWPSDFYYHYAGFLAPFLALAVGLAVSRLAGLPRLAGPRLAAGTAVAAAIAILVMAAIQARAESSLRPAVAPGAVAAAQRIIPPGACVLADQVSYTIAADRFPSQPGCPHIVDAVGSDYSLSRGRNASTGAGRSPAVRALWLAALHRAQYVWLSTLSAKRIPWSVPGISAYFHRDFRRVPGGPAGLYVRKG